MGEKSWLPADVALLKQLWDNGLSGTQISFALHGRFSGKAVIGKANRLHLEPRDSTMNRSWAHRTKPQMPHQPKPKVPAKVIEALPEPKPIGPIGTFPEGRTCRYIADEVRGFQCCGHPGYPYCSFHTAKCIVPPQPRKNA